MLLKYRIKTRYWHTQNQTTESDWAQKTLTRTSLVPLLVDISCLRVKNTQNCTVHTGDPHKISKSRTVEGTRRAKMFMHIFNFYYSHEVTSQSEHSKVSEGEV